MKRKLRIAFIAIFIVISPLFIMSQQPPHPNGGVDPGAGNGPVGGGAPIDNGLLILLALSFGYGARNHFNKQRKMPG